MPGKPRTRITVVVADDHPLYRDGVVRALLACGQVEIVAEAPDGRVALAAIQEHQPDVALLDYKLPGLDGVAVTHAVIRERLRTRVLIVSAFTDSGIVYKAIETGATGFISKEASREHIVDAVLACARGENVVPPEIAGGLVSEIRLRKQNDAPVAHSPRAGDPASDRGREEPAADCGRALSGLHHEDARPDSAVTSSRFFGSCGRRPMTTTSNSRTAMVTPNVTIHSIWETCIYGASGRQNARGLFHRSVSAREPVV